MSSSSSVVTPGSANSRNNLRFVVLRLAGFFLVFAALQVTWQSLRGSWVEHFIINDCTVRPAAALVNFLTPGVRASAVGSSLLAPGGGISILNGCEGMEALFLLAAAFAIAPLALRSRLGGFLLGIVVVFAINQVRILVLFYSYRANPGLFEPLHGTVMPIIVIVLVSAYFYGWLARAAHKPAAAG